jgi:hypothetical protein
MLTDGLNQERLELARNFCLHAIRLHFLLARAYNTLSLPLSLSLPGEEGVRTLFTGQREREREGGRGRDKERDRER